MKRLLIIAALSMAAQFNGYGQYTFVFLHKKSDNEKVSEAEVKRIMDGHMANMERLAKENKLLAAGPFNGGGGLFILNTQSAEEARAWLSTDPGIQANRWNVEMLPYKPRYGGVCAVGENYQMINYTFVRFTPIADKTTVTEFQELINQHDKFLLSMVSKGDVVTEAIFGERDGGILILKNDAMKETFSEDPGVQQGLIDVDIKKLFIAKGSFCEK